MFPNFCDQTFHLLPILEKNELLDIKNNLFENFTKKLGTFEQV
jgi:hypothetical protein